MGLSRGNACISDAVSLYINLHVFCQHGAAMICSSLQVKGCMAAFSCCCLPVLQFCLYCSLQQLSICSFMRCKPHACHKSHSKVSMCTGVGQLGCIRSTQCSRLQAYSAAQPAGSDTTVLLVVDLQHAALPLPTTLVGRLWPPTSLLYKAPPEQHHMSWSSVRTAAGGEWP